jgi:hypothetical protein
MTSTTARPAELTGRIVRPGDAALPEAIEPYRELAVRVLEIGSGGYDVFNSCARWNAGLDTSPGFRL